MLNSIIYLLGQDCLKLKKELNLLKMPKHLVEDFLIFIDSIKNVKNT